MSSNSSYSMTALGPSNFLTLLWRNRQGKTSQMVIYPPEADSSEGHFLFRITKAPVANNASWSLFPGYNRHVLVLEGQGIRLDHGPHGTAELTRYSKPHLFAGEWETQPTLAQGPIVDFNVMVAHGRAETAIDVHGVEKEKKIICSLVAPFHFFYCAEGRVQATLTCTGKTNVLSAGRAVFLEAQDYRPDETCARFSLTSLSARSVVIGVGIFYSAENEILKNS